MNVRILKQALCLFFFLLISAAGFSQYYKPIGPKDSTIITFEKMEYDFGKITSGDSIFHDFKFTNTGKKPLIILSAKAGCGCTVPEWPRHPIKKGESAVIRASFNSTGKESMQDRPIMIYSNAKGSPHELRLKGDVLPKGKR